MSSNGIQHQPRLACIWHGMCAYGKWRGQWHTDSNKDCTHGRGISIFDMGRQPMGIWHHPRPTFANIACFHLLIDDDKLYKTLYKACTHQLCCVHIDWATSATVWNIGWCMRASVKRHRPMGGRNTQVLHTSVVEFVHRVSDISPELRISRRHPPNVSNTNQGLHMYIVV